MSIFKKKEKTPDEKMKEMEEAVFGKMNEEETLIYKLLKMSGTPEQIFMFGHHMGKHAVVDRIIGMMPEKMRKDFEEFSENEDCGDPDCDAHNRKK